MNNSIINFGFMIAFILSMYSQFKVSNTFSKYSQKFASRSMTGAEVATFLLQRNGIYDVQVQSISGNLSDHYDPTSRIIRLSESVYSKKSIAAISVAAHETGHAIQHNIGYLPLNFRSTFFPVFRISSNLAMPLIMFGLFMASSGGIAGILMDIGLILLTATAVFHLLTLPVEFNASSRAIRMMQENNILSYDEITPAKKVLNAAALTYVASTIVIIMQILRLFSMRRNS